MFVIVSLTEITAPLFIFVNVPEDGKDLGNLDGVGGIGGIGGILERDSEL